MVVLYLSNNPNLGGTSRILKSWLEGSIKCGERVALVVREEGKLASWARERQIPVLVAGRKPFDAPGVGSLLPAVARIHWWLIRHGLAPEIVHCNDHDSYRLGDIVARLTRAAKVCHVRFLINREFAKWAFGGRRCPDALLWTSQFQQGACEDAVRNLVAADRQEIIYLGISAKQFVRANSERVATRAAWKVNEGDVVLGMACHFEPRKRIEDFVDVVHQLRQAGFPVRGVVAGKVTQERFDGYERQIREKIAVLNLTEYVQLLGRVDPVQQVYEAIDLFVSTSEMETFGNSICEAMAYRLPVLAYRGGSVPEVVGDAGALVENGSVEALATAAAEIVNDMTLRNALGARGLERVADKFDPDRQFAELRTIHQGLLDRKRGSRSTSRVRVV